MTLLPIIDRELRIASRSTRMYLTRFFAGAAALAVAIYMVWLAKELGGASGAGTFVLRFASYAALAICLFAGVNRTADCLSSEKREDTLGLLFLTHLKARDIVLGKLLAHSSSTLLMLLGIVPILSLPILLGGVSAVELVRIPVALLNSLFLALSFGLLVSSLLKRQSATRTTVTAGMILLTLGLPALALDLVQKVWQLPTLSLFLLLPSPLYPLEMAFASAAGLSTNWFWTAISVQFAMALAGLITAALVLPRAWQIRATGPIAFRWQERIDQWSLGSAVVRAKRRAKLLKKNPILWLNYRQRFAPLKPLFFAALVFAVVIWCIFHYDIPAEPGFLLLFFVLALNDLAMRFRVAGIASMRLAQDRQTGALETILSTPITIREIVQGHWMAIRRTLLWTYVPLLLIFGILSKAFSEEVNSDSDIFRINLFMVIMSVGDFVVTGYVAIWKGMRVINPAHATGATILRVLLMPWFVWFGLLPLIGEVAAIKDFFQRNAPYSFLITAAAVWSLSSLSALYFARRNIYAHFREAATDRYMFESRYGRIFFFWGTRGTTGGKDEKPVSVLPFIPVRHRQSGN